MANEFVARKGIISSGSINVSGSVTASYFKGDGSQLTNLPLSTVLSSSVSIDTYTFNGDGSTKIFLLSQSYYVNSLEVFVDGLAQTNITDYTLSSATLTFVDTPPSASNILVKAFTNVAQNVTGSFSGSFFGIVTTASYAQTASYALNAGAGSGFPFSGSAVINGSLLVVPTGNVNGITGSVSGALTGTFPYSGLTSVPSGIVSSSSQVVSYISDQTITPGVITASGDIVPSANETYDLGSPTLKWKDLYLSGSTIYLGTLQLKDQAGTLGVVNQSNETLPISGSFTGSLLGTSSLAENVEYEDILNKPTLFSSSAQLPSGIASSSAQIKDYLPTDTVSSSAQLTAFLPSNTVSSSGQVTEFLPVGTISSSNQVQLDSITGTIFANTNYTFPQAVTASNVLITNVATVRELRTLFVTSSVIYESGSTKFGDSSEDTHEFTGSIFVHQGAISATTLTGTLSTAAQTNITSVGTLSSLTVSGDLTVDTSTLKVDAANNRVGIGITAPVTKLHVNDGTGRNFLAVSDATQQGTAGIAIGSFNDTAAAYAPLSILGSVISFNNNVGIGTTTPGQLLTLGKSSGNFYTSFVGDATALMGLLFGTSENTVDGQILYTNGTRVMSFVTALAERMRIDASGNVGIGTTNPNFPLVVGLPGTTADTILQIGSSASSTGNLFFGDATGTGAESFAGYIQYQHANNSMLLGTAAAPRLTIDSTGNVGIGTVNPYNKLTIEGSSARMDLNNAGGASRKALLLEPLGFSGNAYARIESYDYGASAGGTLVLNATGGNVGIGRTPSGYTLDIATGGNALRMERGGVEMGGFISSTVPFWGSLTNDPFVLATNSVERMRIDASGNVGIGTTSPSHKLQIGTNSAGGNIGLYASSFGNNGFLRLYGTSAEQAQIGAFSSSIVGIYVFPGSGLDLYSNGSVAIKVNTSGNVGIGTTTPGQLLTLGKSSGNFYTSFVGDATATMGLLFGTSGNTVDGQILYTNNTQVMSFVTALAERMRIDASGNVGIGTTSPSGKLDVRGTIYAGVGSFSNSMSATNAIGVSAGTIGQSTGIEFYTNDGTYNPRAWIVHTNSTGAQALTFNSTFSAGTGFANFNFLNGNVGIGTATPSTKLDVFTGTAGTFITGTNDAIRLQVPGYNDTARNTIVWHQDSSDLILARYGIEWNATTSQMCFVWRDMYNSAAGSSELMRLTGGGNLGIGTTNPGSYKLYVSGDQYISGTLTEASSIALKENLNPITDALTIISQLKGYIYDRKDGSATQQAGLIAEEVEHILPNIVSRDSDGNASGVQYTKIIAYLVESIKELKQELDSLRK